MIEIKRVIYACDIGSTLYQKKRGGPAFGWARINPSEGTKSIRGSSEQAALQNQLQDFCALRLHGCQPALTGNMKCSTPETRTRS